MEFTGFGRDAIRFLADLARNNNRPWFLANKDRYERSVRAAAVAFIEAMAPRLERISPHIYADPSPNGGSLMRIYRDARFTAGKQPYKTNIGIQFRHEQGDDVHAPGLYFHIDAKEFFLAAGMWRPPGPALAAVRARIGERPAEWLAARDNRAFVRTWGEIQGDRLIRPPRGFDPAHPCIEDLKLKDILAVVNLPRAEMLRPGLVDTVAKAYAAASPLMKFMCQALELPY